MLTNEQHSKLMEELVDGNTADGRKAIIVTDLIKDYDDSIKQREEMEKKAQSAKDENKLLLEAHHRLFKQTSFGYKEEEKPKSFSQTITIDEIERKHRQY
jgi:transposase-like protein